MIIAGKIAAEAGLQDDFIEEHQQLMSCSQHGFGRFELELSLFCIFVERYVRKLLGKTRKTTLY